MKDLSTAIYSKFTALVGGVHNSFYTSITGRLYRENAPQGATEPYAVYSIISNTPDLTFDKQYEYARIQFSIFTNDPSPKTSETAYGYLKSLYDRSTFTITGNVLVYMKRVNYVPSVDPSDGTIGCHVDYEVMMEKT